MQLKVTKNKLSNAPKSHVRLEMLEKGTERFVEKNGVTTLQVVSGKHKDMTARKLRLFIRGIVQSAKKYKIEKLALEIDKKAFPKLKDHDEAWLYSTLAENLKLANYEFTKYKTKKDKYALKEVLICGGLTKKASEGFKRGNTLGDYLNLARDIANTPALDMTPSKLEKAAKDAVKGTKASVKVLSTTDVRKEKMGALMAVGQGAKEGPRLIILEYWGAGKASKKAAAKGKTKKRNIDKNDPIIFVGKGITYDTGGLNVKPSGAMHDMHLDMTGGATVIGAVAAAAKLGLKKNIIGLVPTAENAVSRDSMRAGDIITAHSGKTIEIMHTDAEGRLVLADALSYSKRYNPKLAIDVATLTGAALVALGQHTSAIMTKDEKLQNRLQELGEETGDYMWPLPLWDEYKEHIKGINADIANIAPNFSRFGGTIEGGTFLSFFAPNCPWAHIDIAPRMEAIASDRLAKGATGEPVRLLVKLAEIY